MNKFRSAALLSIVAVVGLVSGVRAQEYRLNKDLRMTLGYKLWINTWQTTAGENETQGGAHYNSIVARGVPASIPNFSLRYKDFLFATSVLTTGEYDFPTYTAMIGSSGFSAPTHRLKTVKYTAKREEYDVNFGYFVHPSIVLTIGYKGVTQKFTTKTSAPGLTFCGGSTDAACTSTSKTTYNGVTFGVAGSAAIGGGFSIYGNGVGGYLTAKYEGSRYNDYGLYEASEVGLAFKPRSAPLTVTLGYKYQLIDTFPNLDNPSNRNGYRKQVGSDVSRGYVLGLSLLF